MAESTVQTNNARIKFRNQITKEYFRFNPFSPDMGEGPNAIIRRLNETRQDGDQMNVPLVQQLKGAGRGTGTLVGNEEALEDYGCRLWIDTARNAVMTRKREAHKDGARLYNEARPLLSNWGINTQRNEIIESLMALLSESPPANLQSDDGDRVNGIRYEAGSAGQKNTWHDDNSDRVLYGASFGNFVASDHAASLANVDATNDLITGKLLGKMKVLAKRANPKITPIRVTQGSNREYYKAYVGTTIFNDLKEDLKTVNADARPRVVEQNPIFQDGDLLYDGIIIREIPEIDEFNATWGLDAAGATGTTVHPAFLVGQSALGMPWGMLPTPTELKEDDYGHKMGVGIEMCYGVGKLFMKVPKAGTALKQFGVVTGFFGQSAQ